MKYLLGGAAAALLLAGAAAPAFAAQGSQSVSASAEVIAPLTSSQQQALDFKKLVLDASNTAGTLVVAASNGARSVTGGVNLVGGTSGDAGIVQFVGQSGNSYTVAIPSSGITLNGPGGATMTVDTFTTSDTLSSISGTNNIHVGATLHVSSSQAAGAYTGSFTVTASYD